MSVLFSLKNSLLGLFSNLSVLKSRFKKITLLSVLLLALFTVVLLSCKTSKISVSEMNFNEQIDRQQNLVFTFNYDIVNDTLFNKWDTTQYMTFSPSVRGRFQWKSARELVFSPEAGFQANTDYKATLSPILSKLSKEKKAVKTDPIVFHTPYLELMNARLFWSLSEAMANTLVVQANLTFNYPVKASELDKKLRIITNDYQVIHRMVTAGESDNIIVEFPAPTNAGDQEVPVKIFVDKGLSCVNSEKSTDYLMEKTANIPARGNLMVIGMTPEFVEGQGVIHVFTSQPILTNNLKEIISIKPSVDFEIDGQDNTINLKGAFLEDKTYNIRISAKLTGIFGKPMDKDYEQAVTFTKSKPFISFTDPGSLYMSSKGEKNLGIRMGNVSKVKISVFKVFENNIMHYLRNGKQYSYMYDETSMDDEYYDSNEWPMDENYGKMVYEKQVNVQSLPKNLNTYLLNLNLQDIDYNNSFKGFYIVKVEDDSRRYLRDAVMVSVSDIGLIVKKGKNDMFIVANSILESKPLAGIRLDFISTNNQKVYTATTNAEGIIMLKDMNKLFPGFDISMITARSGEDFNFLNFNDNRIETSRYEVGGKYTNNIDYDVFIYGDRKLYRPGDSVYINAIARTLDWQNASGIPLKYKIIAPNGKQLISFRKETNKQGAAEIAFKLPNSSLTGVYTLEVYSGNDIMLNSYRFSTEEFMPDRIAVKVELSGTQLNSGDRLMVNVDANNLFGTPATGRKVENEMSLNRTIIHPKGFSDYDFNVNVKNDIAIENIVRTTKTDDNGRASEVFTMPIFEGVGMLQGKIYSTVFDETGRPVNRVSLFEFSTQDVFFGVKYFDTYISTHRPFTFNMAAVNKKGAAMNTSTKVQIIRNEYESVIQRSGSNYSYNSNRREVVVLNQTVSFTGGKSQINYTPTKSGEYEIRIYSNKGDGYVSRRFYSYGASDTEFSSFNVDKDGEILIEKDKESYNVGESADLLFKCPFSGKIIVTVERNEVMDYFILDAKDKSAVLKLPIKDGYVPNMYVTATAIRSLTSSEIPLTVAHGILPITVEKKENKLPVTITAPGQSFSRTKQTVEVTAEAGSQVTIAVVDEGILQMTNYKTPDPYDYFYQKRALEVNSFDLYARIFPELKRYASSFGGDLALDMSKRVNPMTNKRVKLIALWSGILNNTSGKVRYSFDIPHFSGSLRVMAVAWKDKKFGSAEANIKVADPIVISTALPRFLSPGDQVECPVTLSNTTSKSASVVVKISNKGPVKVNGETSQTITIPANSERRVEFNLSADYIIGESQVVVSAVHEGKTYSEEVDLTIRPAAGLIKVFEAGVVEGNSLNFTVNADFIAGSATSKLLVSKSPMVEFSRDLSELLHYPYGCLEQTVSTAFPLLYYRDIAKAIHQENKNMEWNPDYLVQEAIYKVQGLQQYNGGMLYWSSGGQVNWWATTYAIHFLIEAKKAGFEVNQLVIDNGIKYIGQESKESRIEEYFIYDVYGRLNKEKMVKQEVCYSLFVMSLAGKPSISLMNHYKGKLISLTEESKYLLAAAFGLSGDKANYRFILPKQYDYPLYKRDFDGSFNSMIRNMALVLYVLNETEPSNPQITQIARKLSVDVKNSRWLSTQDRSFALLALGKMSKQNMNNVINGTISAGGEQVGVFKNQDFITSKNLNNKPITITKTGTGKLYYFYQTEGISRTGNVADQDKYLMVRKSFFDRFGKPITGDDFEQNALIVVKLSVISTDKSTIPNVAVTDMLPACFEIENPRLTADREYSWTKDRAIPEFLDMRDDRITMFTTVTGYVKNFYYLVRVVSKGTYKMGPVSADAMYDGNYYSYYGSRSVSVK